MGMLLDKTAELKVQFARSAYINIGLIALVTLFATVGVLTLSSALDRSGTVTKVMRNHMFADMKHDSIRADLYNMYLAASTGDRAQMQAVDESFRDNAAGFRTSMAANEKLDVPEDMQAALAGVQRPLEDYINQTGRLIEQMRNNAGQVSKAEMDDFARVFDALAVRMEDVSERIETLDADASSSNKVLSMSLLALTVLIGGGAVVFSFYLRRHNTDNIVGPVSEIAEVMQAMAESDGDSSITIPYTDRSNAIGRMANSLLVFRKSAEDRRKAELAAAEAERLDLERRHEMEEQERKRRADEDAQLARTSNRQQLATGFEQRVASLARDLKARADVLRRSADVVGRAAGDTASKSRESVRNAQSAGNSVQSVAAAAEEMAASIAEITSRVQDSSRITADANNAANSAVSQVDMLDQVAQRVGAVVKLINDIAEQTNLLALNATIEAARAGDAGKGFAVVASEVKSLANQTGRATGEIEQQIGEMQSAIRSAIAAVRDVTDRIGRIDEISGSIASAVEQQSAATGEIGRAAAMASDMTATVSSSIEGVGAAADTSVSTMAEVESAAGDLLSLAENLDKQVAAFVAELAN
ncbi:MAG: hypothetical protein EP335_05225 [Alphaproteobacteria bacterium]|nr:MAG: hypothetical protein EP335_05225 [Alphaproteobacteria bacterium]